MDAHRAHDLLDAFGQTRKQFFGALNLWGENVEHHPRFDRFSTQSQQNHHIVQVANRTARDHQAGQTAVAHTVW